VSVALPDAREQVREEMVPRHSAIATAQAMFNTSQTERRLAHRYRLSALDAELKGNLRDYRYYALAHRKHWRRAIFYLYHARLWFEGALS